MRLWSIHPKYLDRAGLTALWREALLAQKVLNGRTKGYKNHPQLRRFHSHSQPRKAIGKYLRDVWRESKVRGYNFDQTLIKVEGPAKKIPLNRGQLRYEFDLLRAKLRNRDPLRCQRLPSASNARPHPFFRIVEGEIEEWEKAKPVVDRSGSGDT